MSIWDNHQSNSPDGESLPKWAPVLEGDQFQGTITNIKHVPQFNEGKGGFVVSLSATVQPTYAGQPWEPKDPDGNPVPWNEFVIIPTKMQADDLKDADAAPGDRVASVFQGKKKLEGKSYSMNLYDTAVQKGGMASVAAAAAPAAPAAPAPSAADLFAS